MGEAYPKREGTHFAHRALRLLVKTAAAQEIGPTAVALVMTVAMTEDSARYRRAVTFYNDQLLPLVGVTKWDSLDRARRKAVAAGWLHYENRGKRLPGLYWVTIPATAEGIGDGPVDEGSIPENGYTTDEYITPEIAVSIPAGGGNRGDKGGDKAGVKGGINRGQRGGTSYPTPNPFPIPFPKEENPPTPLCSLVDESDSFDARMADWELFLAAYPPNSDGVKLGQERAKGLFASMVPADRQSATKAAQRYAASEIAAGGMVQRMERWLDSGDWRAYLQKSTGPPRKKLVGGVDLDNLGSLSGP